MTVVGLGVEANNIEARTKYNPSEPIRLFCVTRISEKKRIDLCIKALCELNKTKIRYTLQIIGSGDYILEGELRKLISELNLDNQVVFSGFLEGLQKTNAIAGADIFLLPSENENFAVAVAESISAGKPVVVSKFVAMHEFVDRHQTGITIKSLEVDELASAIESVHRDYLKFQQNCIDSSPLLRWEEVQKNWLRALDV
jgi:glycosyltransferase involved in cell wall biosynthesis